MKIKNFIYTLTVIAAAVSCTKSGSELVQSESAQLIINTSIKASTKSAAVLGTTFGHESSINVIMGGASARSSIYVLKDPTGTAGTWLPSIGVGIELTSTSEDVYAHYPAELPNSSTVDNETLTLTPKLKTTLNFGTPNDYNADNSFNIEFSAGESSEVLMADGEYDYMTGKGDLQVNLSNKEVELIMKHTSAMIVIRTTKTKENTNPGILKLLQLSNTSSGSKPLKEGSFNLVNNHFTAGGEVTYKRAMNDFADGTFFAMMVYPADIADQEVMLKLGVDNTEYDIKIPAIKWESGKIIRYNVTLTATKAEINGPITVLDWTEGNKYEFPLE